MAPGLGVEAVLRCCVQARSIGRAKSRPEGLAPRSLDRLGLGQKVAISLGAGVESYAETTLASRRGSWSQPALERPC